MTSLRSLSKAGEQSFVDLALNSNTSVHINTSTGEQFVQLSLYNANAAASIAEVKLTDHTTWKNFQVLLGVASSAERAIVLPLTLPPGWELYVKANQTSVTAAGTVHQ